VEEATRLAYTSAVAPTAAEGGILAGAARSNDDDTDGTAEYMGMVTVRAPLTGERTNPASPDQTPVFVMPLVFWGTSLSNVHSI